MIFKGHNSKQCLQFLWQAGRLFLVYWYKNLVRSFNNSTQATRSIRFFRPLQMLMSQDGITVWNPRVIHSLLLNKNLQGVCKLHSLSLGVKWLRTRLLNILQTTEVTHKSTYKLRLKKIHSALHLGTHAVGSEGCWKSDFKVPPFKYTNHSKADTSPVPPSIVKGSTTQKYITAESASSSPDSIRNANTAQRRNPVLC